MRFRTLAITILSFAVLVLFVLKGPELQRFVEAVEWMRTAGPLGDAAFFAFYGIGTLLLVPASWNTGAAGFLYGPFLGAAITSLYSTLFAAIAFLLGRTVLRHRVERRIATNPRYAALDQAIGERGLPMVVLIRLSPVSPFNPLHYILSASCVSFRDFVLGTWIGGLLPAVIWSRVGASVSDLGALLSGENTGPAWFPILGIVLTLALTVPITLLARNALRDALQVPDAR